MFHPCENHNINLNLVKWIDVRYNSGMKKPITIVLISDNHGQKECLTYIRRTYPKADYYIHCGDTELPPYLLDGFAVVQGNNDFYNQYPLRKVLEIGGHRILVTHGHRDMIFGKFEMLAAKAKAFDCDVVFFGHTHIYHDNTYDGVRVLNPGSIWRNRDGSKPSYMIVTIDGDSITAERKTYQKT